MQTLQELVETRYATWIVRSQDPNPFGFEFGTDALLDRLKIQAQRDAEQWKNFSDERCHHLAMGLNTYQRESAVLHLESNRVITQYCPIVVDAQYPKIAHIFVVEGNQIIFESLEDLLTSLSSQTMVSPTLAHSN